MNQYIQQQNKRLFSVRQRMIPAIALLLVSALLLSTASYAWITLAQAPELSGVTTNVGANGNLEIALATADHLQKLTTNGMIDTDEGTQYASDDLIITNTLWGNLLDLNSELYGLHELQMKPTTLNIVNNAVQPNPIQTAYYGEDGRISALGNYSSTGAYDSKSGSYLTGNTTPYGVRIAGTPANAGLYEKVAVSSQSLIMAARVIFQNYEGMITDITYNQKNANYLSSARSFVDALRGIPEDSETGAVAVPGLVDKIETLVDEIDSAYGTMLGNGEFDNSPVTRTHKALDAIVKCLDAADEKLTEIETSGNPSATRIRDVIALLIGEDIEFYYIVRNPLLDDAGKQQKDKDGNLLWNETSIVDTNHTKLGEESLCVDVSTGSVFYHIAEICGEYEVPASSIKWKFAPSSEERGAVQEIQAVSMEATYQKYSAKMEQMKGEYTAHNNTIREIASNIFDSALRYYLHYMFALNDEDMAAASAPKYTDTKNHYYLSNGHMDCVRDYLNALLEEVAYADEFMRTALIAYGSSGILSADKYYDIFSTVNREGSTLVECIDSAGLKADDFLTYASTVDTSVPIIQAALDEITALEVRVTDNEDPQKNRNYLTWEELCSLWRVFLDLDALTVNGRPSEEIDDVLLETIGTVSFSNTVLSQFAQLGDFDDYTTVFSEHFSSANPTYQILRGKRLSMNIPGGYSHEDFWIYTESGYEESRDPKNGWHQTHGSLYRAFESIYINNRITEPGYQEFYEAVAQNAWKKVNTFRSYKLKDLYGSVFGEIVVDGVLNDTSNATYSTAYADKLRVFLSNMEPAMESCEDALVALLLLYAEGIDQNKAITKDAQTTDPDEPMLSEILNNAISAGQSLDTLVMLSGIEDDAFTRAHQQYMEMQNVLDRARTYADAAGTSWNSLNNVVECFFTVDEYLINTPNVTVSGNYRVFDDVLQLFAEYDLSEKPQDFGNGAGSVRHHPLSKVSDNPNDLLFKQYRSVQVADMDFDERTFYSFSTNMESLKALFSLYSAVSVDPDHNITDREYVHMASKTATKSYALQVQDHYTKKYGSIQSNLLGLPTSIVLQQLEEPVVDNKRTYTKSEIEDYCDNLTVLDEMISCYFDYLKYALRVIASGANTSRVTYEQFMECSTIPDMLTVLNIQETNPLYISYHSMVEQKATIDTVRGNLQDLQNQGSSTLKSADIANALSPMFDFRKATLNGLSIQDFQASIEADVRTFVEHVMVEGFPVMSIPSECLGEIISVVQTSAGTIHYGANVAEIDIVFEGIFLSDIGCHFSLQHSGARHLATIYQQVMGSQLPYTPSATSLNNSSNYLLDETYCFAVDLLFRTNADGAHLVLQTDEALRIDPGTGTSALYADQVMGGGSYLDTGEAKFDDAMRIVFADTVTGEIYGYAKQYEEQLYLVDENGLPQEYIIPMEKNRVYAITAWVYVDGERIDNASISQVLITDLKLNLQFATDVSLQPADLYEPVSE